MTLLVDVSTQIDAVALYSPTIQYVPALTITAFVTGIKLAPALIAVDAVWAMRVAGAPPELEYSANMPDAPVAA
jgi:hypothetical protein